MPESTTIPLTDADISEQRIELSDIFALALERNASDIHLGDGDRISLRINGRLLFVDGVETLSKQQAERLIYQMLEPEEINQLLKVKELDFSYQHADGTMFRGSVYFRRKRLAVALRLVPQNIKSIEELELPPFVYRMVNANQGLVLITGPTGSGKSTSMAAMLEYINQNQVRHIITIEDPIEFIFQPKNSIFSQRELHTDTLSFSHALKSALREDPNVVVISEMRDPETFTAAMTIAETGHLVFATLHTSGAPQTINRIISAFPPTQQDQIQSRLADVLLGIISQRLLPRIGGGRIGVFETLFNTPAVANMIRSGDNHLIKNAIETGQSLGMISMERAVSDLVAQGHVDEADVEFMFPSDTAYGSV